MSAGEHETFIKTPKQLITIVVLSFVVPVLLIVMLAQLATGGLKMTGATADDADAVRGRVQPVAAVALAGAAGPKVHQSGEQVFNQVCTACHGSNSAVPGSPKLGDKAAWAPLIKEGLETITADAIKGIRGMPARGGNPNLSDVEVARAIVYIANRSGANWKEPEAPKGEAAPAPAQQQAAAPSAPPPSPTPSTVPANTIKTAAAATGAAAAAPAAGSGDKGQSVYNTACMACHATGAANAPKTGDKAAWGARVSKGAATLYDHAIKGFNAMPAKGGNTALSDADVKAAVDYMLARSK
jgi:cytochrome c5